MNLLAFTAILISIFLASCGSTTEDVDCGVSRFSAVQVSRQSVIDENTIMDRHSYWAVKPVYPPEAKRQRLSGTVHLRVLVASDGKLMKACPTFDTDQPRPSRVLVDAALAAVKQWRFRRNFGQGENAPASFKYGWSTVEITYKLSGEPEK